ncbi:hypothetical protein X766_33715 [Mesorhizobium sp. LSJC255A00]|uniref:hypothetical protein n=1 Tax=Mesorhizobium sp. LSJC255A00 TaxID=1287313 RepID=UPI0003CE68DD|nr:hypothetical protein [Mesorhizobium sp. LSJC255A00]ESX09176.1 hypothetical protein X766_33715 [Mesorhizobium sp. LSJC255A00]
MDVFGNWSVDKAGHVGVQGEDSGAEVARHPEALKFPFGTVDQGVRFSQKRFYFASWRKNISALLDTDPLDLRPGASFQLRVVQKCTLRKLSNLAARLCHLAGVTGHLLPEGTERQYANDANGLRELIPGWRD